MKEAIKKVFEKKYLEKYPDKNANDYAYYHIMRILDESIHEGLVEDAGQQIAEGLHPYNTPLMALMHDTRHDFDKLRNAADVMSRVLKERKEPDSNLWVGIEYVKSAGKSIMNQLDDFYIKNRPKKTE